MRFHVFVTILAVMLLALASSLGVILDAAAAGQAQHHARVHLTNTSADVVVKVDGSISMDRVSAFAASKGVKVGYKGPSGEVLTLKSHVSDSFLEELSSVPGVLDVASELKAHTLFTPNDPDYNLQWGTRAIRANSSWDITTGSHSVVVGELDTGIDWDHPDLAANMWSNTQGYHGYNFISNNWQPMDDNINSYDETGVWVPNTYTYHGTHVAGIIGAQINNGIGVAGMAQVLLMAVKVMNDSGEGTDVTVSEGVKWATDNGADIITMSLGVDGQSTVLQDQINYAASKGVVLVAASGNNGASFVSYPAAYPQVIAVGAIDQTLGRASFSNWGDGLEIMAPGDNIYSTKYPSSYQSLSGTSTATPYVAGVAALMLSVNPGLTPVRLREALNATAIDISTGGYDLMTGWGIVNAFKAVALVSGPMVTITGIPSYVVPNGTFSATWLVSGEKPGNPGNISRTYLQLGQSVSGLAQVTSNFTGTTYQFYTANDLPSLPANGTLFLRAVAFIDGTQYNSSVEEVPVHEAVNNNPFTRFVNNMEHFIVNDLGVLNFALIVIGLIALVAIVAAARHRSRPTYHQQPSFQPPSTLQGVPQRPYLPPPPPPPPRFESHLDIIGHEVTPSVLKVAEGTKVVWVNKSWAPPPGVSIKSGRLDETGEHPDGMFQSGMLIAPGDYWSATFHRAGTYDYYLTGIWRSGKIIVEKFAEGGPSTGNA